MRLIRSRTTILSKNIKLVIIGNNMEEVLERIQSGFKNQFFVFVWQVKAREYQSFRL